jgi:lysozyme family protein
MTAENFSRAYEAVRGYEGGNVDDPKDPGGRTSRGVTQRVYDAYRKSTGMGAQDVYKASEDEIKTIYRDQYWSAVKGDDLPSGIDLLAFDSAIHSGPKQSAKFLQAGLVSLGKTVAVDGIVGVATIEAAKAVDRAALINAICERRMGFLKALSTWGRFGKGWTSRIVSVKRASLAMAGARPAPSAPVIAVKTAKAPPPPVAPPTDQSQAGTSTAGGGAVIAVAAQGIQQAKDALTPYAGQWSVLDKALIGLTAIGALVTVVGLGYSYWKGRQAQKAVAANDATLTAKVPA